MWADRRVKEVGSLPSTDAPAFIVKMRKQNFRGGTDFFSLRFTAGKSLKSGLHDSN